VSDVLKIAALVIFLFVGTGVVEAINNLAGELSKCNEQMAGLNYMTIEMDKNMRELKETMDKLNNIPKPPFLK